MSTRYIKNTIIFSVVTVVFAIVWGFFLSCENPFSNNLGKKVDVEPPTITVDTPTVGDFVKGLVHFSGSATAYRELRSIEVKIFSPHDSAEDPQPAILDWTNVNVHMTGDNIKAKNWTYELDTANYFGPGQGLEDGFLKIQFRARDPSLFTNTVELIYIVKNKPSVVKLTAPDVSGLKVPQVQTGMEISGTITDRRGIKPGFPRIKLWPENMPEPAADHPTWGWVQLFLSGIDDVDNWTYTDRNNMQVVRAASFSFLLCHYQIDMNRQAVYDKPSGNYKSLDVQRYNFRIYTSETYFDEKTDIQVINPDTGAAVSSPNPRFWFPRDPRPEDDEAEITGYYPETDLNVYPDPQNRGPAYLVQLMAAQVPPEIHLDNGDVPPSERESNGQLKVPNFYIDEPTERKIRVGGTSARPYFRLRIQATHDQYPIARAVLEWEHRTSQRSGYLQWDNIGTDGFVDDTDGFSQAKEGHYGDGDPLGKFFVFTALDNTLYFNKTGGPISAPVFTASPDPYTLKVTVFVDGISDLKAVQNYTVYLNNTVPEVSIQSVWGAEKTPASFTDPLEYFNDDPYAVNGNVQVVVRRSANMGILPKTLSPQEQAANNITESSIPWVRWIIEADTGSNHTDTAVNTATVLARLKEYALAPTADKLGFFEKDITGMVGNGWVNRPLTNPVLEADRGEHFKVNTVKWNMDKQYVWLYIIVQDSMHNLGYVMQKIYINQDGDKPQIKVQGDFKDSSEINADSFHGTGDNPASQNVLDAHEGIELSFSDDDGIKITAADIVITLTEIDGAVPPRSVTLNNAQLEFLAGKDSPGLVNSKLELSGLLKPDLMAQALYGSGEKLNDGRYWLTITVRDNAAAKVRITPPTVPSDTPQAETATQTFFFAVRSEQPVIEIKSPLENFVDEPKEVNGEVVSSFPLQSLKIEFSSTNLTPDGTGIRYFVQNGTVLGGCSLSRVNGKYVYSWTVGNVDFSIASDSTSTFTVTAFDELGFSDEKSHSVRVDNEPPQITMEEFNFGRQGAVNGKVPIIVRAFDDQGLGERVISGTRYVDVQWWALTSATAAPVVNVGADWNTNWNGNNTVSGGYTGRFKADDDMGGGIFTLVLDTRALTNGTTYILYAIARDGAGNLSVGGVRNLHSFTVDQAGDLPLIETLEPQGGVRRSMGLSISGTVSDDDEFNRDSPKRSYAVNDYGTNAASMENRNYVQIRFYIDAAGRATKWYNAECDVDTMGNLTFYLDLETAAEPNSLEFERYFTSAGVKKYQIRVMDEPEPGVGNPGKNPEVKANVAVIPAVTPALIGAAEKVFPGDNEYYQFTLKNDAPKIWFKNNDPDIGHRGFYNNDSETVNNIENYTDYRPSFNKVQGLTQALADIYVEEILEELALVRVIFTPQTGDQIIKQIYPAPPGTNFKSHTGSRHYFDVLQSWMSGGAGNFNFDTQNQGRLSIAVEAIDSLSQRTRVDWDYYKDTTGPELTWITDINVPLTGRGGGTTYIRGKFSDDYSPIADTFEWTITPEAGGTGWSNTAENIFSKSGNSAEWRIPIPDNCPEGDYILTVVGRDRIGNANYPPDPLSGIPTDEPYLPKPTPEGGITTWGPFDFKLDNNPPDISLVPHMVVGGNGLSTASGPFNPTRLETETERVFSAANVSGADATIFTLSGLVYEYSLTSLKAVYSNGGDAIRIADLTDIDDWSEDGTAWTFNTTGNKTTANPLNSVVTISGRNYLQNAAGNYRIRKAYPAGVDYSLYTEIPAQNQKYLYVWELDVRKSDFSALLNGENGVPGDLAAGVRRQITITASDLAGYTSGRRNWRFYLDNQSPQVGFLNLDTPNLSAVPPVLPSVLNSSNISISMEAKDDTSIREIKYIVSKFDYEADEWRYHDGTAWNSALRPSSDSWPVLYGPQHYTSIVSTKYLDIDNAALERSGVKLDPLEYNRPEEGKYRISFHVTDWSLSSVDAGNPNVREGPEFYIDRHDPDIQWFGDADRDSSFKGYYKIVSNSLIFYFTVADVNTIKTGAADVSARLQFSDGATINGIVAFTGTNYGINPLEGTITFSSIGSRPNGRSTVSLSIRDGAGNLASVNDSQSFYLDNDPPNIALSTALQTKLTDAITGRVEFRSSFTKNSMTASPISLVAFCIAENASGYDPATIKDVSDTQFNDDLGNYWYHADGMPRLMVNGKNLIEIEPGLVTANIVIGNTRDFIGSSYIGAGQSVTSTGESITFNGKPIAGTEIVHKLTIYLLAVDEAGNKHAEPFTFWVYPAGDLPVVTSITTPPEGVAESDRIMNGRIRIAGIAEDNVRIKYVWFRVRDEGSPVGSSIPLYVPKWDASWNEAVPQEAQTAQTINGSGGWYMANGGGGKRVSWWAYINENGELDPQGGATSRPIIVEVMAEDTYWTVDPQHNSGDIFGWDTGAGLFSGVKNAPALIVSGAPRFDDERILLAENYEKLPGSNNIDFSGWGTIANTKIKGKAVYSITVKNEIGIASIRWVKGSSTSLDLIGRTDESVEGLSITAMPKQLLNGSLPPLPNGRQYMIWEPEDRRYEKVSGAYNEGGTVLAETEDHFFEWVVVVKVDADKLVAKDEAKRYPIQLRANDVSKPIALFSNQGVFLPIDNKPPKGMYTHSANVAGSAATFGGEAGDWGNDANVDVFGLSRVVIWFSNHNETTGREQSISWKKGSAFSSGGASLPDDTTLGAAGGLPEYVTIPAELGVNPSTMGTGNVSSIIIDRNDPMGGTPHHGHQLRMGFATIGGEYDTAWYVTLDSTELPSGRVTAHYIVYDQAGNATYYNQKLMVMNGVPRISRIKLGTDIRGNNPDLQTTLGTGNQSLDTSSAGVISALTRIRNAFTGTSGSGVSAGSPESAMGISDYIDIDTSVMGEYSVVYDVPFNARNRLLTIEVEADLDTNDDSGRNRYFRFEYVSGSRLISGRTAMIDGTSGIKRGKVYIINNPGGDTNNKFPWGSFGAKAKDDNYRKGIVFLAVEDGNLVNVPDLSYGTGSNAPSVWELNNDYYSGSERNGPPAAKSSLTLADVRYDTSSPAKTAEFVYGANAFNSITNFAPVLYGADRDYQPRPYTADRTETENAAWNPLTEHSLFIVRVFDAYTSNVPANNSSENELFGDFVLLSIRVNNNDVTPPFAQLYDLNPKTEGGSLAPQFVGNNGNRIMGGLWEEMDAQTMLLRKQGHIEPRRMSADAGYGSAYTSGSRNQHSLTGVQMGGASNNNDVTVYKPFVEPAGFFSADTVSGRVILRGYVEDDQRIESVALQIGAAPAITILENNGGAAANQGTAPNTGFLRVPAARNGEVYYTDTVDLNRHRVEWAYIWNTETIPGGDLVVGNNINVRVLSYNTHNSTAQPANTTKASPQLPETDRRAHTAVSNQNPDFPLGLNKYNSINVNLRPYITGFAREKTVNSFHDERSLQGRYMFSRGETFVVKGFNLGNGTGNTVITLPVANNQTTSFTTGAASAANITAYGLGTVSNAAVRYRILTNPAAISDTVVTGNGIVGLTVNNFPAVNTGTGTNERPRKADGSCYIQPWNTERNPAIEGSDLWDDFIRVHIWRSDNNTNNTDNGYFRTSSNDNWTVLNPAMSIDSADGRLFESHNEGGSGANANSGTLRTSNNYQTAVSGAIIDFIDPVIYSDIYRSPGGGGNGGIAAATWTVSSVIGRYGNNEEWRALGGIWMNGPNGANMPFGTMATAAGANQNMYNGESTWYNASSRSNTTANPPTTDQFSNPHIVTSYSGTAGATREHIHVSYYDIKDGSIKYRYNLRTTATGNNATRAGTIDTGIATGGNATNDTNNARNIPKMWTNLDGGVDQDDLDQTVYTHTDVGTGTIAANARVVRYSANIAGTQTARGNINAGEHNAIAVTSHGYPVIAYFDQTNQRLKLAVSRSTSPVLASNWVIRDYVIPRDNLSSYSTGQYVSMKIDTVAGTNQNRVHIAALNSMNNNLVYITGIINPNAGTGNTSMDETETANVLSDVKVQVVDSAGDVGRWCSLSLDSAGRPWIAYHDITYLGSMDGVKLACLDPSFTKELFDVYGGDITGWETMHIPARWKVENPIFAGRENGRVGLECWPARNAGPTGTAHNRWGAAVSYASSSGMATPNNRYRIAYYVK